MSDKPKEVRVTVFDGKYTFVVTDELALRVLRYGEEWTEDVRPTNAVFHLVSEHAELTEEVKDTREANRVLREHVADLRVSLKDLLVFARALHVRLPEGSCARFESFAVVPQVEGTLTRTELK